MDITVLGTNSDFIIETPVSVAPAVADFSGGVINITSNRNIVQTSTSAVLEGGSITLNANNGSIGQDGQPIRTQAQILEASADGGSGSIYIRQVGTVKLQGLIAGGAVGSKISLTVLPLATESANISSSTQFSVRSNEVHLETIQGSIGDSAEHLQVFANKVSLETQKGSLSAGGSVFIEVSPRSGNLTKLTKIVANGEIVVNAFGTLQVLERVESVEGQINLATIGGNLILDTNAHVNASHEINLVSSNDIILNRFVNIEGKGIVALLAGSANGNSLDIQSDQNEVQLTMTTTGVGFIGFGQASPPSFSGTNNSLTAIDAQLKIDGTDSGSVKFTGNDEITVREISFSSGKHLGRCHTVRTEKVNIGDLFFSEHFKADLEANRLSIHKGDCIVSAKKAWSCALGELELKASKGSIMQVQVFDGLCLVRNLSACPIIIHGKGLRTFTLRAGEELRVLESLEGDGRKDGISRRGVQRIQTSLGCLMLAEISMSTLFKREQLLDAIVKSVSHERLADELFKTAAALCIVSGKRGPYNE